MVYNGKSTGPRTEPCGTAQEILSITQNRTNLDPLRMVGGGGVRLKSIPDHTTKKRKNSI